MTSYPSSDFWLYYMPVVWKFAGRFLQLGANPNLLGHEIIWHLVQQSSLWLFPEATLRRPNSDANETSLLVKKMGLKIFPPAEKFSLEFGDRKYIQVCGCEEEDVKFLLHYSNSYCIIQVIIALSSDFL